MAGLSHAENPPPWLKGAPKDANGRFTNIDGSVPSHGFLDFLKWRIVDAPKARKAAKGEKPALRIENDGAFLRSNTTEPTVTWIGHSTALIQISGLNILTDPNFSPSLGFFPSLGLGRKRFVPLGLKLKDLPRIDVVLISHSHYDHLDKETIRKLSPSVNFLVPKGFKSWFASLGRDRCEELDWGQKTDISGKTFWFLPLNHWSRRGLTDMNKRLWGSWLIQAGETKILFVGDSGYFAGFKQIGSLFTGITVAILPMGAYEPRWIMKENHMNPEETVQAFQDLNAHILVPIHWGTFKVTDEPMDEPPKRLLKAAESQGISKDKIKILKVGETLKVPTQ